MILTDRIAAAVNKIAAERQVVLAESVRPLLQRAIRDAAAAHAAMDCPALDVNIACFLAGYEAGMAGCAAREMVEHETNLADKTILDRPIRDLELSVRGRKLCYRLGLQTIEDVTNTTIDQLLNTKGCGISTVCDIKEQLKKHGLTLREDIPEKTAAVKTPKIVLSEIIQKTPVKPIELTAANFPSLLKQLSYREREVFNLRYGLGDGHRYTLGEVSHIFKVTRERVRQIETKAIRKLCRLSGASDEQLGEFLREQMAKREAAKQG